MSISNKIHISFKSIFYFLKFNIIIHRFLIVDSNANMVIDIFNGSIMFYFKTFDLHDMLCTQKTHISIGYQLYTIKFKYNYNDNSNITIQIKYILLVSFRHVHFISIYTLYIFYYDTLFIIYILVQPTKITKNKATDFDIYLFHQLKNHYSSFYSKSDLYLAII